jgi:hypothetical protein
LPLCSTSATRIRIGGSEVQCPRVLNRGIRWGEWKGILDNYRMPRCVTSSA